MAIPAHKTAYFIVVQPHLLRIFELLLNTPPSPNSPSHALKRRAQRCIHQVVGLLCRLVRNPANEYPVLSIVFPPIQNGNTGPIEEERSFRTRFYTELLPILLSHEEVLCLGHGHQLASFSSHDPNLFCAGNCECKGVMVVFQPGSQIKFVALKGICYYQSMGIWASYRRSIIRRANSHLVEKRTASGMPA